MEAQAKGAPRSAGGGWRALLPQTRWGWSALGLLGIFGAGLLWFLGLVASGWHGGDRLSFSDPSLAPGILMVLGMAGAFVSSIVGVFFRSERSLLGVLTLAASSMAALFIAGELVLGGLLGLGG